MVGHYVKVTAGRAYAKVYAKGCGVPVPKGFMDLSPTMSHDYESDGTLVTVCVPSQFVADYEVL